MVDQNDKSCKNYTMHNYSNKKSPSYPVFLTMLQLETILEAVTGYKFKDDSVEAAQARVELKRRMRNVVSGVKRKGVKP